EQARRRSLVGGEVGGERAAVAAADGQFGAGEGVGGDGEEGEAGRVGGAVEQLVGLGADDRPPVGREPCVAVVAGFGEVVGEVADVLLQAVAEREEVGGVGVVDHVPAGAGVEAGARALPVEGGDDVVLVGDAGDPGARVGGSFEVDGRADGDGGGDGVAGGEAGGLGGGLAGGALGA